MAIQIRRGTESQWNANKSNIVAGEPAVTTDTEKAFIGTGNGTYMELANKDSVPTPYTSTPEMDGTATPGSVAMYARGDHRHPTDSTRASQTDMTTAQGDISALQTAMTEAQADLEKKADSDGDYDNLTSGSSKQLIGGTPTLNQEPYKFRKSEAVGTRMKDEIVGCSIVWNQLAYAPSESRTAVGLTFTNNNNKTVTITGTTNSTSKFRIVSSTNMFIDLINTHVYFISVGGTVPNNARINISESIGMVGNAGANYLLTKAFATDTGYLGLQTPSTFGEFNSTYCPQVFDLTAMFGTEIADYIYNLENTNSGDGAALFRKLFPNSYYPYNRGELLSVEGLQSHDTVGFNLFDGSKVTTTNTANWGVNWDDLTNTLTIQHKTSYTTGLPSTELNIPAGQYEITYTGTYYTHVSIYEDGSFVKLLNTGSNFTITSGKQYDLFFEATANTTETFSNICVHSTADPSKNGTYEPYSKHSYALDSTVTLRGVPKLVNNTIVADGDIYPASGEGQRRYGIVDLGTLNWSYQTTYQYMYASISNGKATSSSRGTFAICSKYIVDTTSSNLSLPDKTMSVGSDFVSRSVCAVVVHDSAYSDAATFKSAMNGVMLVYELATPTTFEAEPYTEVQVVSPYGTEEYVSGNVVPVGHNTEYYADLVSKLDGLPWDLSMIAPIEDGTTSARAYSVGQYFLHNNQFCKAKTSIAVGATFTLNTNYTVTTVAAELYSALQ